MSSQCVCTLVLLLLSATAAPLRAQTPAQPAPANTVDRGAINGAPYYIEIPSTWNKGLVLYTHGYTVPRTNSTNRDVENRHPAPTYL